MEYVYCSIKMKRYDRSYSYISPFGRLRPGTAVMVPFGADNALEKGWVLSCGVFTEETAPFPPDRTKQISRVISHEEYEQDFSGGAEADEAAEALDYADDCLSTEDDDLVYQWAMEHYGSRDWRILAKVQQCLSWCARRNIPEAALNLGSMYYTGHGAAQDYKKAYVLYEAAAKAGICQAITNCGYCWYYGRHAPADKTKARSYFELGALLYDDANCLYKLGDLYLYGEGGLSKNPDYAFILYNRAYEQAEKEDPQILGDAASRVGRCLLRGIGTARDAEAAYPYLQKAAAAFYQRRKIDPFAAGLIKKAKMLLTEAEQAMEEE